MKDDQESGFGERRETEIGDRVRFVADDVFLPGGSEPAIAAESELEGVVIGFSDSGLRVRAFAVVEVVKKQLMVVPVEKLKSA